MGNPQGMAEAVTKKEFDFPGKVQDIRQRIAFVLDLLLREQLREKIEIISSNETIYPGRLNSDEELKRAVAAQLIADLVAMHRFEDPVNPIEAKNLLLRFIRKTKASTINDIPETKYDEPALAISLHVRNLLNNQSVQNTQRQLLTIQREINNLLNSSHALTLRRAQRLQDELVPLRRDLQNQLRGMIVTEFTRSEVRVVSDETLRIIDELVKLPLDQTNSLSVTLLAWQLRLAQIADSGQPNYQKGILLNGIWGAISQYRVSEVLKLIQGKWKDEEKEDALGLRRGSYQDFVGKLKSLEGRFYADIIAARAEVRSRKEQDENLQRLKTTAQVLSFPEAHLRYAESLFLIIQRLRKEENPANFVEELARGVERWLQQEFQVEVKIKTNDTFFKTQGIYYDSRLQIDPGSVPKEKLGEYAIYTFGYELSFFDMGSPSGSEEKDYRDYRSRLPKELELPYNQVDVVEKVKYENMVAALGHMLDQMHARFTQEPPSLEDINIRDLETMKGLIRYMDREVQVWTLQRLEETTPLKIEVLFYGPNGKYMMPQIRYPEANQTPQGTVAARAVMLRGKVLEAIEKENKHTKENLGLDDLSISMDKNDYANPFFRFSIKRRAEVRSAGRPSTPPHSGPTGPRAEVRQTTSLERSKEVARKVVTLFFDGKTTNLGEARTVAESVAQTLKTIPAIEFGKMVRSEARFLLDQIEKERKVPTAVTVDKVLAEKAIDWFTNSLVTGKFGNNLAIAFDTEVNPSFLDALRRMKSRVGLAFFEKKMAKGLAHKELEGLTFQFIGDLARYRPSQALTVQNPKAVPVVNDALQAGYLGTNESLFGVGINKSNIEGEPYLEVVEKVVQIVIGLLVAEKIKKPSDLKKPDEIEKIRAALLKELFQEQSLPDIVAFQNGNLVINRSSLRNFITEYLARAQIQKAA